MTEVLVKIPDSQLPFFIALLERLQFVEVESINGQPLSKKDFLDQFEAAIADSELEARLDAVNDNEI